MPNLKTIDVAESGNKGLYMTYLGNLNPNEYLLHIEEIKDDVLDLRMNYKAREKLLLSVYFNFRRTLNHLKLRYCDNNMYTFGDKIDVSLLDFLTYFAQLTNLDFYNEADENLTMFDIQEICPNLVKFKFRSPYNMMDQEATTTISEPSYFNCNLQVLKLELPSLTTPYIQYIIQHLPQHLHTLHIELTNNLDILDWMKQVGVDNALKLGQRMSVMNNSIIEFQPEKGYRRLPDSESRMTRFFRLFGATKGNRKIMVFSNE